VTTTQPPRTMPFAPRGAPRHGLLSLISQLSFVLPFCPSFAVASATYDPFSAAAKCPSPCAATDDGGWTVYRDISQLVNCNQTILLELNLNHGVDSAASQVPFRACLVQESTVRLKRQPFSFGSGNGTNSTSEGLSQPQDFSIQWRGQGKDSGSNWAAITDAISALARAINSQKSGSSTILFAKSGPAIVGVYAGSQIENTNLGHIVQQFAEREAGHQVDQVAAQLCSQDSLGSLVVWIFVDTTGDLRPVKAALGGWNNATCLDSGGGQTETWAAVTVAAQAVDKKTGSHYLCSTQATIVVAGITEVSFCTTSRSSDRSLPTLAPPILS